MIEVWKDIKFYEGLYQVSNLGNVRSLDRYVSCKRWGRQLKKGIILDLKPKANGYVYATLVSYGIVRHYRVHRLVASAFLSGEKEAVNHKDGNKSNNHIDNLEWVTNSENCIHKVKVLGKQIGGDIHNARLVLCKSTGIFYETLKEACNALVLDYKKQSSILSGARKGKSELEYA